MANFLEQKSRRRHLLRSLAFTSLLPLLPRFLRAAEKTPSSTEGPFYPSQSMRFPDMDNDLVKIKGAIRESGGEVLHLSGTVYDANQQPAAGARVEIWQCDANGRYLHTGENGSADRDQHFQGFGHMTTGADGRYFFRTIKPVSYPGRTPHIHVKAIHDNETLTTQFYIEGHEENQRDGIYNNLSVAEKSLVSMKLSQGAEGLVTNLDIYC